MTDYLAIVRMLGPLIRVAALRRLRHGSLRRRGDPHLRRLYLEVREQVGARRKRMISCYPVDRSHQSLSLIHI